jgi:hypothetical protein
MITIRRPIAAALIARRASPLVAAAISLMPAACVQGQIVAPSALLQPATLQPASAAHGHSAPSAALAEQGVLPAPTGSFAAWLAQPVNRITITPSGSNVLVFNVASAARVADWLDSFDGVSQVTHVLRARQQGYEVRWMFTPAPHDGGDQHCYYVIERQRDVLEADHNVAPAYSCRIEDGALAVDVTWTIGSAPAWGGAALSANPPSGTPKHQDFSRWYHQSRSWPQRPITATHAQIYGLLYPRHGAPAGMNVFAADVAHAYVPLGPCGLYRNMRQGGWRRDIGPISEDWARFLAQPTQVNLDAALALSHGAFAMPIHMRDASGGIARFNAATAAAGYILESYYIDVSSRPKGIMVRPRGVGQDVWVTSDWHCWSLDTAHKQSHAHLAWLMTRSPLWREETAFEAQSAIAICETSFTSLNRLSTQQERDGLRGASTLVSAIHAAPALDDASLPAAAAYQPILSQTQSWWLGNMQADPFGGLNLAAYLSQFSGNAPWEIFNDPLAPTPNPIPATVRKIRFTTPIADEAVAVFWRAWQTLGDTTARELMKLSAKKHIADRVIVSGLYSANQSLPAQLVDVTGGTVAVVAGTDWAQAFAHAGMAAALTRDKAGWRNPTAPDAFNGHPAGRAWGEGPTTNGVQYPIYVTQLWGQLQLAHDSLGVDTPADVITALRYMNRQFALAQTGPSSITATNPQGGTYTWSPRPVCDGYQFSYAYPASIAL